MALRLVQVHHISQCRWKRGVYLVEGAGLLKIGFARDVADRLAALQLGSPVPLRVVAYVPGEARKLERWLHLRYKHCRMHGEWFEPGPELEMFAAGYLPHVLEEFEQEQRAIEYEAFELDVRRRTAEIISRRNAA